MNLMKNPSLTIQGEASGLYAVQQQLELRLQNEITPTLQKVSAGTWDMSDIINIGGFTGLIVKQINDVRKLEQRGGGVAPSMFDMDTTTIAVGAVVLLGLGLVSGVLFGKRSTT